MSPLREAMRAPAACPPCANLWPGGKESFAVSRAFGCDACAAIVARAVLEFFQRAAADRLPDPPAAPAAAGAAR